MRHPRWRPAGAVAWGAAALRVLAGAAGVAGVAATAGIAVVAGIGLVAGPAAAAPGRPFSVIAAPCNAAGSAGACTADPTGLVASWPPGAPVVGVVVSWLGADRPAGAPAPSSAAETLLDGSATCADSAAGTTCSWGWPGGLRLPAGGQLLNGTYQVAPCGAGAAPPVGGGPASGCAPVSGLDPVVVTVSVVPAAPAGVTVTGSGSATLHWTPSPEADLAGYRVARDGVGIWVCSANGAPGTTVVCPADPGMTDSPPAGRHTYSVEALRYGPTAGALLSSAPSTVAVTVSTAGAALPAVPYSGPVPTLPAGRPAQPAAPTTTIAADPGYQSTLPYGSPPPSDATSLPALRSNGALARATSPPAAPSSGQRDHLALFAAGMLLLAVAAHVIYLRSEVARRDALFRALAGAAPVSPASPELVASGTQAQAPAPASGTRQPSNTAPMT